MSEDPQRAQNVKKFHDLLARAHDINKAENSFEDYSSYMVTPNPRDPNSALSLLYQISEQTIENEQKRFTDLFQTVETMLNEKSTASKSFSLPQASFLRQNFAKWTKTSPPVKQPPYTPLCGAMEAPKDKIISPGSYACAPVGEEFYLVYIIGFDPEELCYHCCDADPVGDELSEIVVPMKELIPMPTSVPSKHLKGTYYPVRSRVLAMWPMQGENSQWTSAFYSATVSEVPKSSPGIYKLKFDGLPPIFEDVPEQMIVKHPLE